MRFSFSHLQLLRDVRSRCSMVFVWLCKTAYIRVLILFVCWTLECKQFPFWQASQSSPFLEATIFSSCLPYLSSHSFCSIVLLSFTYFILYKKCRVIKHVQSVVYGLMWGSILLNPSILPFNTHSLIFPHPMFSYLQKIDSLVESLRRNSSL